jgi:flagellar protein FliO/FliZ
VTRKIQAMIAEISKTFASAGHGPSCVACSRPPAKARFAIAMFTFVGAASAVAAEAEKFAAPQTAERATTPGAGSLVQVTLSLVLVLAAVFAAAWLLRRLKTISKFSSGPIEIVADVSVGPKERAVLVQVGGKQLLLGVAPGRVTTLHVLDQPVASATQQTAIDGQDVSGALQRPDFKSILKRSLGL